MTDPWIEKAEEYLNLPYHRVIVPAEEGGYIGGILELPGCMTQGDNLEHVWEMINDAMLGWLAVALEEGQDIPLPREDWSDL